MFSQILDCPVCSHRFSYEHGENHFPESIPCPACGQISPAFDFSALTLCHECQSKLKIPLDDLFRNDLTCPQCGSHVDTQASYIHENALPAFDDNGKNARTVHKRLLQDGAVFDKYRIIRILGVGGMAEVYLAEHLLLKKQCALKLMQNNFASDDPVYARRFLREARLSHKIEHPNIVRVFDVGSDFKSGHLFIAMEYVDGKTLFQLLQEKKLSEKDLRSILSSMTEALQALAQANIVHRDIKPSNIMIDQNGVLKLMDLGIAKSENNSHVGEITLTLEQSVIGTPSYAPPEQCKAAHHADIRSDIYCLGATIYHAASGHLPFDGNTPMEIICKVLQENPVPLKHYRPDLSPDFLNIIDKMMRKNPRDRFASPEALQQALSHSRNHAIIAGFAGFLKDFRPGNQSRTSQYILRTAQLLAGTALVVLLILQIRSQLGAPSPQPENSTLLTAENTASGSVETHTTPPQTPVHNTKISAPPKIPQKLTASNTAVQTADADDTALLLALQAPPIIVTAMYKNGLDFHKEVLFCGQKATIFSHLLDNIHSPIGNKNDKIATIQALLARGYQPSPAEKQTLSALSHLLEQPQISSAETLGRTEKAKLFPLVQMAAEEGCRDFILAAYKIGFDFHQKGDFLGTRMSLFSYMIRLLQKESPVQEKQLDCVQALLKNGFAPDLKEAKLMQSIPNLKKE